ncbi:class I SAM-dependent methyltransferase [Chromatocurvus halotolerans]|uniref:Methyltransferase family protein n=1 Tax=Chromatocurvus halotolerans TaxID=1132028 RepID=A0A4V2SB65_9GAMM|nr:class I SAM-dependent methyltransferase [Chromatocurvus halotolerans]TCO74310.1 methyltransferase family protein [Chromatocurvus halotolerans]
MEQPISLQLLNIMLLTAILAISLWIFRKASKIHKASYRLIDDAAIVRKETQALFAQCQALRILESKLHLDQPLPATRGWAGSPDFLLTLADQVLAKKPTIVVECSSGVSTLVIARCLQLNGHGHAYSLEHDQTYAKKTEDMLTSFNLNDYATILYAPLVVKGNDSAWYDESVLSDHIAPIDILIVDGPPESTAPLARLPAVPRLLPRMNANATIILDDADREAERETVKRWLQMEPTFHVNHLHHEKGCVILSR